MYFGRECKKYVQCFLSFTGAVALPTGVRLLWEVYRIPTVFALFLPSGCFLAVGIEDFYRVMTFVISDMLTQSCDLS